MTESHLIPPFLAAEPAGCQCHKDAGAALAETEACLCHLDAGSEPQEIDQARASEIRNRRKESDRPLSGEGAGWFVPALRVALLVPVLALGLALVMTGLAPVLFAVLVLLLPALAPIVVVLLAIAATLEGRPAKVVRPASSPAAAAAALGGSAARRASSHSRVGV